MKRRFSMGGRSGFSLIELIVVIAIVLVLGGLGGVALSHSMQKGRVTASMSNLRQLSTAALTWSAENDGQLLPHAVFDQSINENREWCFAYVSSDNPLQEGLLGPYLGEIEQAVKCPAWKLSKQAEDAYRKQGKPGTVGYGYNGFRLSEQVDPANGHWRGFSQAAVANPSRTVMFATSGTRSGSRTLPNENIWDRGWSMAPCIRAVDGKYALVAWLDGRVSRERLVGLIKVADGTQLGYLDTNEDGTADTDIFDLQ